MQPRSSADGPRTRILFLAANPDSTAPLHAGREVRRIRDRLAGTAYQSALEIVERWAVRPSDLQQALIEIQPHIVHFSGHGSAEYELMLEGDDGSPRPIGKAVLSELFRLRGAGVRAVVLSACHSLPQAEAIAEHVDCAIGMRRAIGSEAATEFSAALYHAIGSGDSIRRAFDAARLHLEATGIPEHRTPQLVVRRDGVNLERSLVRKAPAAALPHQQILRLHAAAVSSQLPSSRAALLGGIDPELVDGLPLCKSETGQILSDLHGLNAAARSGDGDLPLSLWLGNALALVGQGADAQVFWSALLAIEATEDVTRPAAPQEGDDIAGELLRIGRAALLATDRQELSRSLYEVESLLARSSHHVEARLLRERILRALPAPERGSFGQHRQMAPVMPMPRLAARSPSPDAGLPSRDERLEQTELRMPATPRVPPSIF
ncbi:MAG TPA: CHAT domain-containing protein, partial [Polyangiaceae bacterium]|nr:CHAT domain-containing protein [Polyangiaceae bacterium]